MNAKTRARTRTRTTCRSQCDLNQPGKTVTEPDGQPLARHRWPLVTPSFQGCLCVSACVFTFRTGRRARIGRQDWSTQPSPQVPMIPCTRGGWRLVFGRRPGCGSEQDVRLCGPSFGFRSFPFFMDFPRGDCCPCRENEPRTQSGRKWTQGIQRTDPPPTRNMHTPPRFRQSGHS